MKESMGWKQDAARLQALGSQPGQAGPARELKGRSHGSDPYGSDPLGMGFSANLK